MHSSGYKFVMFILGFRRNDEVQFKDTVNSLNSSHDPDQVNHLMTGWLE